MLCYLIDDDEDDRDFFAMALEQVDSEIHFASAASAEEALAQLMSETIHPDIIFLDLNMPRINGWECLRLLREISPLSLVPVIIYSTSDKGWNADAQAGYTDFLTKQPRISDLVRKLRDIFSKVNA